MTTNWITKCGAAAGKYSLHAGRSSSARLKSFDNGTRPRLTARLLASDRIFAIKDRKFRSVAKLSRIDIEIKPKHTGPAWRSETSPSVPFPGENGGEKRIIGRASERLRERKGELITLRGGHALSKTPRIYCLVLRGLVLTNGQGWWDLSAIC